jgi:hypothetical protein
MFNSHVQLARTMSHYFPLVRGGSPFSSRRRGKQFSWDQLRKLIGAAQAPARRGSGRVCSDRPDQSEADTRPRRARHAGPPQEDGRPLPDLPRRPHREAPEATRRAAAAALGARGAAASALSRRQSACRRQAAQGSGWPKQPGSEPSLLGTSLILNGIRLDVDIHSASSASRCWLQQTHGRPAGPRKIARRAARSQTDEGNAVLAPQIPDPDPTIRSGGHDRSRV